MDKIEQRNNLLKNR